MNGNVLFISVEFTNFLLFFCLEIHTSNTVVCFQYYYYLLSITRSLITNRNAFRMYCSIITGARSVLMFYQPSRDLQNIIN